MVVYNKLGIRQIMLGLIIGFIIGVIINLIFPSEPIQVFSVVTGILLFLIDWQHRNRAKEYAEYGYQETFLRFLAPTSGGNIMFLPIWIIGAGLIIWGLVGKF